jgi:L-asparagine oxygenase
VERFEVPVAHIEHGTEQPGSQAPSAEAERDVAALLPQLPLPAPLERLINRQIPFVLSLTEPQTTRYRRDLAQPTPDGSAAPHTGRPAAFALLQLLLGRSLGAPYGQSAARPESLVHDVFPCADQLDQPNSSAGARAPFAFHTDRSCATDYHQRPDWVTLGCVRNVERAATRVAELRHVVADLPRRHRRCLTEPNFRFGRQGSKVGPIVSPDTELGESIRLSTDMTPLTTEAEAAYRSLKASSAAVADEVVLEPGQVLFLPNRLCVHGRDPFDPHPDPEQRRYLQRIYIRTSAIRAEREGGRPNHRPPSPPAIRPG